MLKVTVELLPFGGENGRKTIATFDIANEGNGTREYGNYMFRSDNLTGGQWVSVVKEHDRREDVEKLVGKVLEKFYE